MTLKQKENPPPWKNLATYWLTSDIHNYTNQHYTSSTSPCLRLSIRPRGPENWRKVSQLKKKIPEKKKKKTHRADEEYESCIAHIKDIGRN